MTIEKILMRKKLYYLKIKDPGVTGVFII